MVQKLYLNWSDIDQMVEDLRNQIEESGITLHSITGIPRGGLVAATCLSHALGIPYIPFELLLLGNKHQLVRYVNHFALIYEDQL